MLRRSPACLALLALLAPLPARAVLPDGFVDDPIVAGYDQPTGMAFLPDGRLLVTEQRSRKIRLVVNGATSATDPVGLVPDVNATGAERGLLGIAVDPGWPEKPYVYVHYTALSTPSVRIARFALQGDLDFSGDGALTLDTTSRHLVLADAPDAFFIHNGGTLRFGPDGMLYASLGEDGVACAAQDTTTLRGVILRLDVSALPEGPGGPPDKSVLTPADNPFAGHPDPDARLTWATGLRNPFRFSVDPPTGALLIADVGNESWEELSLVEAGGANLGWPLYEGDMAFLSCPGAITTGFTFPIHAYPHVSSHAIIPVGLLRTGPGALDFPAAYDGDVMYTDYYDGVIRRLTLSDGSWGFADPVPGQPGGTAWATGFDQAVDFAPGPDGALWVCLQSIAFQPNTGRIRRIRFGGELAVGIGAPAALDFAPPWPNPARDGVRLSFRMPRAGLVRLALFDAGGRCVRTLLDGARGAGRHEVLWDGRDDQHHRFEGGLCFAVLEALGERRVRRVVVLR